MSREIYAGLAGATATWVQMDVAANNLANASTTGYRAGRVAFRLDGSNPGTLGQSYAGATEVALRLEDGALQPDGDPLHVALSGRGFFVVDDPGGATLTRDGRFTLDVDGRLTTLDGAAVLGEGGPIQLAPGETLRITEDGRVFGSVGGELDRLRLVDAVVEPAGGNRLRPVGGMSEARPTVHQGALEGSNVDAMRVMVELMEAGRHFEAYDKAMRASDEADARLNRLGGG